MNADADRAAHNPKVAGSNPAPATIESAGQSRSARAGSSAVRAIFYRIFYRIVARHVARGRGSTSRGCVTSP